MPHKMFTNECCGGGGWIGTPQPCGCPTSRVRSAWHWGMYEAMGRYSSYTGVLPTGPHRRLTDRLLDFVTLGCVACRGRGIVAAADGDALSACSRCAGFGRLPGPDSPQLAAMREQVLREFPNACGAVALKKPSARVLAPPDVPTWQRRSSAAPPRDPVVWDRTPLDTRRPVLQRARD